MKKLLEILKAALTKFSWINMTQYAAIATLIIQTWQSADLISNGVVLLLTGFITLCLKFWQSSKELVSTGFAQDWSVWFMGIGGMVIGFIDSVITDGAVMELLGPKSTLFVMAYLALTIILRTGFTNQSLNSVAKNK